MDKEPVTVTVIIPVFNEEKHIAGVLNTLINQKWEGFIEIVIVDGDSTDRTREIINQKQKELPQNIEIKLLHNPKRYIPVSLNIACQNASTDIIVRLDGHSYAPSTFIAESIRALKEIKYNGIVGGRWDIKPGAETSTAIAIAIAVRHPLGVGNALYRTFSSSDITLIDVDTVPFGAFTKKLWQELGGYDERLLFDEDSDFNYKARKKGYRIVMNPNIVLQYMARPNYKALWKQYFLYGFWVAKSFIKHKSLPSIRKIAPISFVLLLLLLLLISPKSFLLLLCIYFIPIVIISINEGLIKRKLLLSTLKLVITFPVLHFSYGIGNIVGLLSSVKSIFSKTFRIN